MFLCPLAITLILLTLFSKYFNHSRTVYQFTTYFTLIAALIDGLKASPEFIANTAISKNIVSFGGQYLPLSSIGMGWVLPAIIVFIVGYIIYISKERNTVVE